MLYGRVTSRAKAISSVAASRCQAILLSEQGYLVESTLKRFLKNPAWRVWIPWCSTGMIPTPGQPKKYYGIGAVNYHNGETVVTIQKRKKREQIAELLEKLLEKHPIETVYVAWDNANTHSGGKVEEATDARLPIVNCLFQLRNCLRLLVSFLKNIIICRIKHSLS